MKLNDGSRPMKVRRALDFNLEDLGVSSQTRVKLRGIDEKELLYQIRVKNSRVAGVPRDCFIEVKDIAENEGFIRHDFDERTFAVMRLYDKITKNSKEEHLARSACDFRTNGDYEDFKNFSDAKIESIREFLRGELSEEGYQVLELRYGFGEDSKPKNCAEVAKLLGISYKDVNRICSEAETTLTYPSRATVFRTIMRMSD